METNNSPSDRTSSDYSRSAIAPYELELKRTRRGRYSRPNPRRIVPPSPVLDLEGPEPENIIREVAELRGEEDKALFESAGRLDLPMKGLEVQQNTATRPSCLKHCQDARLDISHNLIIGNFLNTLAVSQQSLPVLRLRLLVLVYSQPLLLTCGRTNK